MKQMRSKSPRALPLVLLCVLMLGWLPLVSSGAWSRETGSGRVEAEVRGEILDVYTYHPRGCVEPAILLVFHGNGRGARSYRDSARALAEESCLIVYSPLFDRERFPNWSYHRGGLVHRDELRPADDWTAPFAEALVHWAREREARPGARVYLFGHSAGGQFLSRAAAYALPEDVERIIIANPSTYVLPSAEEDVPYGFGGLSDKDAAEEWRADYLRAPISIYLGTDDIGSEDLTDTAAARRQGDNRLERGRYIYETARDIAEENGWAFGWRLVHADGVGHTARGMLQADEIIEALAFDEIRYAH